MTVNELLELEIRQESFHNAMGRAKFELSKFPNCPERMIVDGRLAEAQYFLDLMVEKMQKQLDYSGCMG